MPFSLKGFNFPKKIGPGKNREIFDILQSHNQLSTRHLQKQPTLVLTKTAEIGKAESKNSPQNFGLQPLVAP
jgi:hypothetical protein